MGKSYNFGFRRRNAKPKAPKPPEPTVKDLIREEEESKWSYWVAMTYKIEGQQTPRTGDKYG